MNTSDFAERVRVRQTRRVALGLSLAGLGALALADKLQGGGHVLLHTWWPLVLVLWGAARLLWPHPWAATRSRLMGVALMGSGAAMTAVHLTQGAPSPGQWWPVLVILGGVALLVRGLWPRERGDLAAWAQRRAGHRWHGRGHHGRGARCRHCVSTSAS